jgi:hypothetical protein
VVRIAVHGKAGAARALTENEEIAATGARVARVVTIAAATTAGVRASKARRKSNWKSWYPTVFTWTIRLTPS